MASHWRCLAYGDRGAGYRPERHGLPARTGVVQLLFMHVSAKNVIGASGPDAFFRLCRTGDVSPPLRRGCAGMHEQDIVSS